ncbi:hypothetical protein DCS_00585 [Drechmeria coniospora]|uniref:Uncharacterized protein n=1 Tax=Drechmeria coniospora TaxID=98403 RepID=A0A151GQR4_DRECN|nr:hypothetical protein DCS_00585 [Drechmeria coniospora]KYK59455.1 hypothetical protein DCS_00585 [Drechmeria coniospora]
MLASPSGIDYLTVPSADDARKMSTESRLGNASAMPFCDTALADSLAHPSSSTYAYTTNGQAVVPPMQCHSEKRGWRGQVALSLSHACITASLSPFGWQPDELLEIRFRTLALQESKNLAPGTIDATAPDAN